MEGGVWDGDTAGAGLVAEGTADQDRMETGLWRAVEG